MSMADLIRNNIEQCGDLVEINPDHEPYLGHDDELFELLTISENWYNLRNQIIKYLKEKIETDNIAFTWGAAGFESHPVLLIHIQPVPRDDMVEICRKIEDMIYRTTNVYAMVVIHP